MNCDAVQVVLRVPPGNVDPLVPEPFELLLNDGKAGVSVGANHCQAVRIFRDGQLVSERETIFATLRVDIDEPPGDEADGVELFHNYQFWIASDNEDLVKLFRDRGGNTDSQAVLVEDMVFQLAPDGTFFFEAPRPTPSPFRMVETKVGPLISPPLALRDAFWSAVPSGIMKEAAHQDLVLLGDAAGRVEPAPGSDLARIMCGIDGTFAGDALGAIINDAHRGSVRTFFPSGGYTLEVRQQQASPAGHTNCSANADGRA